MRVMYEDPGQMDEKKRLISLLESRSQAQEDSEERRKKKATRRSSRTAGF
jgi:DNA replication regulator DPB11